MKFSPSVHSAYRNTTSATATSLANSYGIDLGLAGAIVAAAAEIGIQPDWLANVIRFESQFKASAVNPSSGAVGLIQFMPATASEVGTSSANLKKMTAVQQMTYVTKYFKLPRIKGKGALSSQLDVFMAVIWPAAIGKGPSYQIFKPGSVESKQNFGIVTAEDYYNLALYGTKPGQSIITAPARAAEQAIDTLTSQIDDFSPSSNNVYWILGGLAAFGLLGLALMSLPRR